MSLSVSHTRSRLQWLALAAGLLLGAALTGCGGKDPLEPSDRLMYSVSDTLFAAIAVGNVHSCALTRGGRAFCWGMNEDGQVGSDAVDDRCRGTMRCAATPTPVASELRFAQLATSGSATCGLTVAGRVACWGGTGGITRNVSPTLVAGVPALRQIASGGGRMCGLDGSGSAWCWSPGSLGGNRDGGTDGGAARAVAGGLRFQALGNRCGTTAAGALYCWDGLVDTTVFDRGAVVLATCVTASTRDQIYTAPCSPDPVRLRKSGALASAAAVARPAARARDCALDAAGAAHCWGSGSPRRLLDTDAVADARPARVEMGVPLIGLFGGTEFGSPLCGRTAGGRVYCRGYDGSGLYGNGRESEATPNPVLVADGMAFESVDASFSHMCGVDAAGAAWCWGYDLHGQLGSGRTAADSCFGTTVTPGAPICSFRPRRVASIAGKR